LRAGNAGLTLMRRTLLRGALPPIHCTGISFELGAQLRHTLLRSCTELLQPFTAAEGGSRSLPIERNPVARPSWCNSVCQNTRVHLSAGLGCV
jgi:hypothetical protein